MDVDAALRALAVAYCHRAEDADATPEQTLTAVSRVLAEDHAAVVTRAGSASGWTTAGALTPTPTPITVFQRCWRAWTR